MGAGHYGQIDSKKKRRRLRTARNHKEREQPINTLAFQFWHDFFSNHGVGGHVGNDLAGEDGLWAKLSHDRAISYSITPCLLDTSLCFALHGGTGVCAVSKVFSYRSAAYWSTILWGARVCVCAR